MTKKRKRQSESTSGDSSPVVKKQCIETATKASLGFQIDKQQKKGDNKLKNSKNKKRKEISHTNNDKGAEKRSLSTAGESTSKKSTVERKPGDVPAKKNSGVKKQEKELTVRQKHKIWKIKQKKKGKWPRSKVQETKEEQSQDVASVYTKIVLPKTPESVSSNWKRLKSVLDNEREKKVKECIKKGRPVRQPLRTRKKDDYDKQPKEESKPEIWFDDVDEIYLDKPTSETSASQKADVNPLVKLGAYTGLTRAVGMDCEMVGVGDGEDSMLARVSIVNQFGEKLYDKFVKPKQKVVDYRTEVSGVRPQDLEHGEDFFLVQQEVAEILKGRLLVGHAIKNDLKVLYLSHPRKYVRDTSQYKPFRQLFNGRTPSLKKLTQKVLTVAVQDGEHNSIQDAQAAMRLYTRYRQQWEKELRMKSKSKVKKTKQVKKS